MTLFHKYYSRKLQFAADVLSALEGAEGNCLPRAALEQLSVRYGISPQLCADVLSLLEKLELILWRREDRSYRLETDWARTVPQLPPSAFEEGYLQRILRLPQAALFLPDSLRAALAKSADWAADANLIQTMLPYGEQEQPSLSQPEFRCILEAITRGCAINYSYKTRASNEATQATAVPWRLEYSAYDNRWWIILYTLGEERRCIKAWLANLSDIRLVPYLHADEEEILAARDELLAPEPIVLLARDARNALERCFLVMEQQQFLESKLHDDGSATLVFRYYRFDEQDILRKLLYLGPEVGLKGPAHLRAALLERVDQALQHFS